MRTSLLGCAALLLSACDGAAQAPSSVELPERALVGGPLSTSDQIELSIKHTSGMTALVDCRFAIRRDDADLAACDLADRDVMVVMNLRIKGIGWCRARASEGSLTTEACVEVRKQTQLEQEHDRLRSELLARSPR